MGTEAVSGSIDRAQRRLNRMVMGIEGVTGTAQGLRGGKPCIKVYVEKDDRRLRTSLPRSVAGIPVDVEVTGKMLRW